MLESELVGGKSEKEEQLPGSTLKLHKIELQFFIDGNRLIVFMFQRSVFRSSQPL